MPLEKFKKPADELAETLDTAFSTAEKEESEPIDLNQEMKKLIEAEVAMSPENFGDSRLKNPQSSWLERVYRLIKEITTKNIKQNSEDPQTYQHEFDQCYLDAVAAYNDRDNNEVKKQIKNIKELLKQLTDSWNIE